MALGLDHSGFDHLHIYKVYIYKERKQLTTIVYSTVHTQNLLDCAFAQISKFYPELVFDGQQEV